MLTTIPFTPGTAASDPAAKYDVFLTAALAGDADYAKWADAEGRYLVLLVGAPHGVPDVMPASRAGWSAYWSEKAEPFFGAVRAALRPGDVLVREIATLPEAVVWATPARIAALAALPEVRTIGLDWPEAVQLLDVVPDGPGVAMGESVGMTQAFDVHALGFLGQGIKLADIDTGILPTHEMLLDEFGNSRVTAWFDATVPPGGAGYCATPCDAHGHGTHTTTTAAGGNLAGGTYQGVAPRAEIYGVRIFQGGGGAWEVAQAGLQASFDMGADLSTNSWGGGCGGPGSGGFVTEQLTQTLALAGMMHVFAAGNSGPGSAGSLCPGRNDYVIGVAATDKSKNIAGFSSGGPCDNGARICPDLSAVGVNVNAGVNTCDTCYTSMSGTSMATPHVAGGAALVMQMNRALHGGAGYSVPTQQLEQFFEANAQDLGAVGNDNTYGWGFIQLKPMRDSLLTGAQARVSVDVSVSNGEIRHNGATTATLMINNVGGKAVSGTARITAGGELEHDGATYLSQAVSLAPGQGTSVQVTIQGASLDPTTYHVTGAFDYAYTADGGATVGTTVEDQTTFVLKGVKMSVARTGGLKPSNWAGNESSVRLTLTNVGNEAATEVELRESIPLPGFVISPGTSTSNPPLGTLSAPAPNNAAVAVEGLTFDMSYAPGSVGAASNYNVNYKVRAVAPGAYEFTAFVTFRDGAGDAFEQTLVQNVNVICPAVKAPTSTGLGTITLPC